MIPILEEVPLQTPFIEYLSLLRLYQPVLCICGRGESADGTQGCCLILREVSWTRETGTVVGLLCAVPFIKLHGMAKTGTRALDSR